jgi:hypothetical protein
MYMGKNIQMKNQDYVLQLLRPSLSWPPRAKQHKYNDLFVLYHPRWAKQSHQRLQCAITDVLAGFFANVYATLMFMSKKTDENISDCALQLFWPDFSCPPRAKQHK